MPRPGVPDAYRRQAQAEGFVSRAVYKLKAIDEKYRLFRQGQRVLDLGSHARFLAAVHRRPHRAPRVWWWAWISRLPGFLSSPP